MPAHRHQRIGDVKIGLRIGQKPCGHGGHDGIGNLNDVGGGVAKLAIGHKWRGRIGCGEAGVPDAICNFHHACFRKIARVQLNTIRIGRGGKVQEGAVDNLQNGTIHRINSAHGNRFAGFPAENAVVENDRVCGRAVAHKSDIVSACARLDRNAIEYGGGPCFSKIHSRSQPKAILVRTFAVQTQRNPLHNRMIVLLRIKIKGRSFAIV